MMGHALILHEWPFHDFSRQQQSRLIQIGRIKTNKRGQRMVSITSFPERAAGRALHNRTFSLGADTPSG